MGVSGDKVTSAECLGVTGIETVADRFLGLKLVLFPWLPRVFCLPVPFLRGLGLSEGLPSMGSLVP